MKKVLCLFLLLLTQQFAFACPLCDKQQPKILRGIAHGAGPDGTLDYVIVWATVAVTVLTLIFALKWLIKPGETEDSHIKRTFLTFD